MRQFSSIFDPSPCCWKIFKFTGVIAFVITFLLFSKEYFKLQATTTGNMIEMPRISRTLNITLITHSRENGDKQIRRNLKCLHKRFENTLLVVAFGAMTEFESMPLFEVMYKKVFPNRLYCGPDYLDGQTTFKESIFLKETTRYGAFLYDCLSRVIEKHQNYTGYIFIGEATILNPRYLHSLNLNKIWTSNRTISGPDLYAQIQHEMEWWTSPWGMQAIEKLYEYFTEINYYNNRKMKLTDGQWTPAWDVSQVLNKWLWNGQGKYRTYYDTETFLYLPKSYTQLYSNLTKHARSSGVRHGIATPTVLRMLELTSQIVQVPTGVITPRTADKVLSDPSWFKQMANAEAIIFLEGKRSEHHDMLNRLTLKEYGIGEFLKYNSC